MNYQGLADEVIAGMSINQTTADQLINISDADIFPLLVAANRLRQHYKGNRVKFCAIVNAKSGRCSENCSFCAQSAHYQTACQVYPLMTKTEMADNAKAAEKNMSATCFSIVTAGKTVHSDQEIAAIGSAVETIARETNLNRCVSLGTLNSEQIKGLKTAGLKRLHHNLETAKSFFAQVCTTHTYEERLATIKLAQAEGLEICSGGIFGLGETPAQRVELAFTLRELNVNSVPINILNPVPGTPAAANHHPLSPFAVLKLIAVYRFILPAKDIGLFGGREKALGSLQPFMFIAGANVTLVGDYLTTKGQSSDKDLQMIKDLGLKIDYV